MVLTNFPNGVSSFGIPTFGAGGLLPFTGSYFWVNETTGSDGNTGGAQDPYKTLAQAQLAATANNNDVVFIEGSIHLSATLTWAKNWVHLIGLTSPSNNGRARISTQTVANGLTQTQFSALHPMVNVTAQGCLFANFEVFYGGDGTLTPPTASIPWAEAGGRNAYQGVQFRGFGDALMAALAGARSITIASAENKFSGCVFGGDTEQRITATNANVEFLAGSSRNVFRECMFEVYNGLSTNLCVLINANHMDRYALFDRCTVNNFGTAMAVMVTNSGGSPGGNVILQDICTVGVTALATSGNTYVTGNIPNATTSGIAVLAT